MPNSEVNKKAIFDNTFWQIIIRFVTLGLTLVSIKILTNYLGTSGIGKFNTITTYINFFIVIADLGLFAVTVREISQNPEREKKILSNAFTLRLWSALAASALACIIVFSTKYDSEIKIGTLIACGFLFFNLLSSVYDMLLQYRLKMQFSALSEFLSRIVSIIALVVIVYLHGNFYWIVSTIALWGLFIFIFKHLLSSRFLRFGLAYDRQLASRILSMSWPLGIVFIVNNLYFKIDTLLLFAIKGASAAGIYTVAYKVLDVIAFIGSYFSSALKPAISQNIQQNNQLVAKLIQKAINVMVLMAAPVVVMSIAFNREIIIFLSNGDFLDSAKVLVFLALTLPFIYLDVLLVEVFIAADKRSTFLKISLFIFCFNVLLNLLLIPRYSYYGAAFTTLLSEIVLLQIYISFAKKIVPLKTDWPALAKIIMVALLTLLFAYAIKIIGIYFLIPMALCLIFYALMLSAFRIVSYRDIKGLIKPAAESPLTKE